MVITEDDLTGKVFKEILTVLGWTRMSGSRRIYAIQCSICKQDAELYGEGIFETSKESLNKGYLSCACGQAYRHSKAQYEVKINRKAKELGVEFLGWLEDFKGGYSKILMRAAQGTWTPRANRFVSKGQISFNRGLKTKDDNLMVQSFLATGAFHPETVFTRYRENQNDKWRWKVECPVCQEVAYSQPQHLQRGNRPCACGNYRQKFAYINLVSDGDLPVALKFGITRSAELRLKYQNRETPFDVKSLGCWEFPDKLQCVLAEKRCKEALVCGILSRQEYGDGYTETTYVNSLEKIIEIYEEYGGVRT